MILVGSVLGGNVIASAHAWALCATPDKIIVVEDGVVAEDVVLEQLSGLNEIYTQLHHLQFDQHVKHRSR